jgi:excisionase family DNA binding protein
MTTKRRIITTEQAAETIGVSRRTVLEWLNRGILAGVRYGPETLRVLVDESGVPVPGPEAAEAGKLFRRSIRRSRLRARRRAMRERGGHGGAS